MYYKLICLVIALSLLRYRVTGIPLISGIYKGFDHNFTNDANNESEIVQVISNELPAVQYPNVIDLSAYGRSLYGVPDINNTGSLVAKFKPNENSVNPEELGTYLEGDILMPQNSLFLKNGLSSKSSRWPYGEVPYEIAGDFTKDDLSVIAFAMDEYHANTCIRFKLRTTEYDYISIVRGNSGCWSAIGRMGGRQEVNLQSPGCLMKPGTAIHELMHVLGFMHEQNRKERDSFVDIQLQNVQRYAVTNFRRMPNTVAFGVGYDYGSVMHYSPNAFSSNGQPTIVAKKPLQKDIMGQREGFSPLDIDKVNRMYNCKVNSKPKEPPVELHARVPQRLQFVQGFSNNPFGTLVRNIFTGFNRLS